MYSLRYVCLNDSRARAYVFYPSDAIRMYTRSEFIPRSRYNLDAARIPVYVNQCAEFAKVVPKERASARGVDGINRKRLRTQLRVRRSRFQLPARDLSREQIERRERINGMARELGGGRTSSLSRKEARHASGISVSRDELARLSLPSRGDSRPRLEEFAISDFRKWRNSYAISRLCLCVLTIRCHLGRFSRSVSPKPIKIDRPTFIKGKQNGVKKMTVK